MKSRRYRKEKRQTRKNKLVYVQSIHKDYKIYDNAFIKGNDLYAVEVNTLEECLHLLDKSYASAFTYDKIKKICYFKIALHHTKSTSDLTMKEMDKNFVTVFKKQVIHNGLICPTYIKHLDYFIILCKSLHFIVDDITFVIIFSSFHDVIKIMHKAYPILCKFKNIQVMTLLFDVEYNGINKYNYQCVKKLWCLDTLDYKNVLLLDSDFEFINAINISKEIEKRGNNLYITNTLDILYELDQKVLHSINKLFHKNYKIFPLNLHWIVNKKIFTHFINYLKKKTNGNYIDFMLKDSGIYFEIVMYHLFLFEFFKKRFTIINYTPLSQKYKKYFLFQMKLDDSEIKAYHADVAIASFVNTDKSKYLMKVHNDRTH
jgi:hypothetical protein